MVCLEHVEANPVESEVDECLQRVRHNGEPDVRQLVAGLVSYSGVAKGTPAGRIEEAVLDEVRHVIAQSADRLRTVTFRSEPLRARALAILEDAQSPASPRFPRAELSGLRHAAAAAGEGSCVTLIDRCIVEHRQLVDRVDWLLCGTSRDEVETLDPVRDSDRIYHSLISNFRVESRTAELLAILRIAASESVALFFRSTGEAETNAVCRLHDTLSLYSNFFEWGEHSKRGTEAVARMNEIHGRYYLPNDGLKYVVLDAIFTWIHCIERIGHRPLCEVEKRGWFHGHVRLGRGMNIDGLTDSFEDMAAWYDDFNRSNARHTKLKTDTFETILGNSLASVQFGGLAEAIHLAARAGMDEHYLGALGYDPPTPEQLRAVRSVMYTLGALAEALPRTAYVRSLQNNPARKGLTCPMELGVDDRSPRLPAPHPERENGGVPCGQRPIASSEDACPLDLPEIPWEEIRKHAGAESLWIVIDGEVYDVTRWAHLHPGGLATLLSRGGRDATAAFAAVEHSEATKIFRLNYRIGRVAVPAHDTNEGAHACPQS